MQIDVDLIHIRAQLKSSYAIGQYWRTSKYGDILRIFCSLVFFTGKTVSVVKQTEDTEEKQNMMKSITFFSCIVCLSCASPTPDAKNSEWFTKMVVEEQGPEGSELNSGGKH